MVELLKESIIKYVAVFRNQKGFPRQYVARVFSVEPGGDVLTNELFADGKIVTVRKWISATFPNLIKAEDNEEDEHSDVYETWI